MKHGCSISEPPRARLPILVLIVVTPLVAEMAWGTVPIQVAYALPFLVPVYGCGALLARELVRRAGRGWASLLLLGVCYEIVEDAFGLQAMFSPYTYDAARWGARALGVNWAYTEFNMVYHVAFTIALPILITDLIFPARRQHAYLRTRGLVITAVVFLLGVVLLRLTVAPNAPGADPAYTAPAVQIVAAGAAVLVLAVVALRILPKAGYRPTRAGNPPSTWLVSIFTAAATVLALQLPAPLDADIAPHPRFGAGLPILAQISASLAVVAVVFTLLWRWSARQGWTDRHLVGVIGGALLAHTAVGASLFAMHNPAELLTLAVFAVSEVALIIALDRRGRDQRPAPPRSEPDIGDQPPVESHV